MGQHPLLYAIIQAWFPFNAGNASPVRTQLAQATQRPKRKDRSGVYSCVACVALDGNPALQSVECSVLWCVVYQKFLFTVMSTIPFNDPPTD